VRLGDDECDRDRLRESVTGLLAVGVPTERVRDVDRDVVSGSVADGDDDGDADAVPAERDDDRDGVADTDADGVGVASSDGVLVSGLDAVGEGDADGDAEAVRFDRDGVRENEPRLCVCDRLGVTVAWRVLVGSAVYVSAERVKDRLRDRAKLGVCVNRVGDTDSDRDVVTGRVGVWLAVADGDGEPRETDGVRADGVALSLRDGLADGVALERVGPERDGVRPVRDGDTVSWCDGVGDGVGVCEPVGRAVRLGVG
jgi:hypothetical protein